MIIETKSPRMRFAAMVCRLLPPAVSGRVSLWIYPKEVARKEDVSFVAESSLADVVLCFPRAEKHATIFAIRGFCEWRNVVIVNTLCGKGDTIIDCGSHIGTETILFAKIVGTSGKVLSFEPFPENYSILEKQVRLNDLKNVVLFKGAVSNVQDKCRFLPPDEPFLTGVGRLANNHGKRGDDTIEVDTFVLDEVFREQEFGAPRMIIMDIEGTELFALKGAEDILSRYKPYLILEYEPVLLSHHGVSPRDLFDFLTTFHYTCWSIGVWGLKPASATYKGGSNLLCIPNGSDRDAVRTAKRVGRRLKLAAVLPLISHINPAVIAG